MDFHNYTTLRQSVKRSMPNHPLASDPNLFYQCIGLEFQHLPHADLLLSQAAHEQKWERLRRPYYNVFPSIVPMLTRLSMDVDSCLIRMPMRSLCVRLPKEPAKTPLRFDRKGEEVHVRAILMSDVRDHGGITLHIDTGECLSGLVLTHPFHDVPRRPGATLEEALADCVRVWGDKDDPDLPYPVMLDCVRLCCTLCLLDEDPEVISPDVLAEDRAMYETTGDPKYVQKALRRGKVGWDIGRHIEVMPHYRRPHFALVWTGPGRKVPKVVKRKGCLVHREVVERIPTGFLGDAYGSPETPVIPTNVDA